MTPAIDLGRAQGLLDDAAATYAVPAAQLGLERGSDRAVVCTGAGPGTPFHAGSLAKSVAGLAVLGAARDGHLDLDTPCEEQGEGLWSDTPRALLSQTTGRPNLLPGTEEDLEAFVARAGAEPRVHAPGRFSYCNAGWSVLDLLLRRTTGRSFEDHATSLLGPSTTFGMPDRAAPGHLAVPGQDPVPVPPMYSPAAAAAGATWWATADQLLDWATLNLHGGEGVHDDDLLTLRTSVATLPGATVFDGWALGWATWDRGGHRAFGWAGYTGGHRAFVRCFPDQDAALVLLASSAGPLFGPPGGSAAFDALLPDLLDLLGVPHLPEPERDVEELPVEDLGGQYGPVTLTVEDADLTLTAEAFGQPVPVPLERIGGNTFTTRGAPPGSTPVAVDGDLLYVGPFALPRG